MELLADDETGVLEQIAYEVVDFDELTGYPLEEPYALRHDRPACPGSPEYREEILPYVSALVLFFSQSPDDIPF